MAHQWYVFLGAADEWLIAYCAIPYELSLPSVRLFSIGHAVELYLKAAVAKITGSVDKAVGYGHDIRRMLRKCKEHDAGFLSSYEIRDSVYHCAGLFGGKIENSLPMDDVRHFLHNQELYIVAKLLPDLKYVGAPLKKIHSQYALGWVTRNPYWTDFFKEIRAYLGWPLENISDTISYHLESGDLPAPAADYLRKLYL